MNALVLLSASLAIQSAEPSDSLPVFSTELDELVIEAKKEVIKSDGASLTYDLSEDTATKGLTLMDALRKVPMITIDGNDKIRINGDSNFKIYVNGKEEPMLEANYDKIFKAMPANSVLKVEVITEPGAKFDAEGTGGILNIITETNQRKDGYSGSLSASASNRDYYFSFLGRMKYRNFSADANVTYGGTSFSDEVHDQTFTTTDNASETFHRQLMEQTQKFVYNFTNASINASWEPNTSNLLTFGGSITAMNAKIKGLHSTTFMFTRDNILLWQNEQDITGKIKTLSSSANASYQHNFGDQRHYLVASWLFNFGRNPIDFTSRNEEVTDSYVQTPWTRNSNVNYTRENTIQLDYSNPFGGEKHRLEAGAKAILRHNSAVGFNAVGQDEQYMSPEAEVNITQLQDIYALYASYSGTYGNMAAVAGVRYEHTKMGMRNNLERKEDFTRHLNDVVPNAALTYLFSPASNLRLAYQMRITRPSLQQMNPFKMDILGTFVQEGNPDLKSEKSNNITLTYTNFGRIMGGNVYVDYKFVDNAIEGFAYSEPGEDGSMITYQTSANIGNRHEFGLGGFYNINLTQKMNISVNGRIAYVKMMSPSPLLKNHGWTGNYGANWSWSGPADIRFSAYGGQTFNVIQLQGSYSGWYYYGVGVSKNLMKDALNVAITASNFLQSATIFKSTTYIGAQTTETEARNRNWRVGLSVTWNFGKLNSQTKKANTQIENDDISNSSGSKGGVGI
ncbi:MAG: TonB-dependent receptor [Bacteroides sp.]|nr:TonB-dependent receptor [Bacteroides sp.]